MYENGVKFRGGEILEFGGGFWLGVEKAALARELELGVCRTG